MAIDTPAKIAVLGAGPIGLEASLYARFLGYDVDVYERGDVANHVLRWGHVRMFSPFRLIRSTLGLAALLAHDPAYKAPDAQARLTGREWAHRYLAPLSRTDLLADAIQVSHQVMAVSREGAIKTDDVGSAGRGEMSFRIALRDTDQKEQIASADVVIDTTGVYGCPNPLGAGGVLALGEMDVQDRIEYGLPDVLGRDRGDYAGRHTLVFGAGCSAATTVVALRQLADEVPETRIDWAVRRPPSLDAEGPIGRLEKNSLIPRDRLAQQANRCAMDVDSQVQFLPGTLVRSIEQKADEPLVVQLTGRHEGGRQYDRIVCHTGFFSDHSLYPQLQVDPCDAAEKPVKPATGRLPSSSKNGSDPPCRSTDRLRLPEPNFYILGSKRYGRNPSFRFADGLNQIRELFAVIGDRADLDLYANMEPLTS